MHTGSVAIKKLVFSDNEVIESISMTESTKKLW